MPLMKLLNNLIKRRAKILSAITKMIEQLENTNKSLDIVKSKAYDKAAYYRQIVLDSELAQKENDRTINKFKKLVE